MKGLSDGYPDMRQSLAQASAPTPLVPTPVLTARTQGILDHVCGCFRRDYPDHPVAGLCAYRYQAARCSLPVVPSRLDPAHAVFGLPRLAAYLLPGCSAREQVA